MSNARRSLGLITSALRQMMMNQANDQLATVQILYFFSLVFSENEYLVVLNFLTVLHLCNNDLFHRADVEYYP